MADKIQQIDELNTKLAEISKQIYSDGLVLKYVAVDDLREQTVNPRSMPQRMFDQLIDNVKNAGNLESLPLCVYIDNHIEIISGHHRTRAARAAGLKHILVLLYENLPDSRIKSKQLAHNTISGMDDPEMVKRVWDQIADVQAKFEAFIDPKLFNSIPEPVKFTPIDVDVQSRIRTVMILFLPTQAVDFQQAVDEIMPKSQVDAVYLASAETYEGWKTAIAKVREDCDIVAAPTAVAEMARLAIEALEKRAAEALSEEEAEGEARG